MAKAAFALWLGLAALWPLPAAAADATVPAGPPVTVFAAASLKESLDQAAAAWTAASGQPVRVSYAASSALARQIEQGAPADLFISADGEWMDYLAQRGQLAAGSRVDLLRNRLVLVAPASSDVDAAALASPAALAAALGADGRLAVAETTSVPAGRYARQALGARGLWPAVSGRLAEGDNVRAALAFVARGEAPLGIVYATDAQAEPRVKVVATFAAADHAPIVYPVARVSGREAGAAFLDFLTGETARELFTRAGFSRP